jgi:predicted enzyme related to lactoylglutathione lyase
MAEPNEYGKIGWIDLTVDDATAVADFYQQVVGWQRQPVPVKDYQDWCVGPPGTDNPVAGICHRRGDNANLPPHWLMYISIPDLDSSLASCQQLGGRVVCPPRTVGSYGRMAVIADPAGAVVALMEPARMSTS